MTVGNVPHSSCRRRIVVVVVVMVTAAVAALRLQVVVVVVVMRRAGHQVIGRVEVAERKPDYFVRLDPPAVVKLEPFQMHYLRTPTNSRCSTTDQLHHGVLQHCISRSLHCVHSSWLLPTVTANAPSVHLLAYKTYTEAHLSADHEKSL